MFDNEDAGDQETFDNPVAGGKSGFPTFEDSQVETDDCDRSPRPFRELELGGESLGCLAKESGLRKSLYTLSQSPVMDVLVVFLVACTAIARVAQMPAYERDLSAGTVSAIGAMDMIILIVFTLEAIVKVVALGFIQGQDTYLSSSLNKLDFIVLCWSWLTVTQEKPVFRLARTVRILKPFQQNKLVCGLNSVLNFAPYIADVVGFLIFFYCIFGAVGVQLFGGVLTYRCHRRLADVNLTAVDCPRNVVCGAETSCVEADPREYLSTYADERVEYIEFYGFDNILWAFLTQFIITTMDEWPAIYAPIASSSPGANTDLAWGYCAVLVMLLSLVVANLFVSVITYGFSQGKRDGAETGATNIAKLRNLFDRIDDDGSGTIEALEIGKLATMLDVKLTDEDIRVAVSELDSDGSGIADLEEFVEWWNSPSRISAQLRRAVIYEEALIQASFEKIDEDGSGTLDAKEVKNLAYHMGITLSKEENQTALQEMELAFEKPGKAPEVNFQQFTAWWLSGTPLSLKISRAAKGEEKKIAKMFAQMDTDDSGFLDIQDFDDNGAAAFGVQLDSAQAAAMVNEMTANTGSKSVDLETFSAWWRTDSETVRGIRQNQQNDEMMASKIFERLIEMTQDGNGRLSPDDFKEIFTQLHLHDVTDEQIRSMVAEIDAGDGQVEFPEFYVWMNSGSEMADTLRTATLELIRREAKPWPYIPGCSEACVSLVNNPNFEYAIIGVVVVNTLVMAMEKYPMSDEEENFVRLAEILFTIIYVAEAIIKFCGMGFVPYIRVGLNQMDLAIVVASVAGMFVPQMSAMASFRVVRLIVKLLRVMRMVKVLAKYDAVVLLLRTTVGSSSLLASLIAVVFIILCLLSIAAGHILGTCHVPSTAGFPGEMDYGQEGFPRENFYFFSSALLSNFQILTGEDWVPMMFAYMKCSGNGAAAYFVTAVVTLNIICLDIFVAVILENFELDEQEKKLKQQSNYLADNENPLRAAVSGTVSERHAMKVMNKGMTLSADATAQDDGEDEEDPRPPAEVGVEKALLCFGHDSGLRINAKAIVATTTFEICILAAIIVSSIIIAIEGPPHAKYLEGEDSIVATMEVLNFIVYFVFLFEMLVRMIADGFVGHETAYIQSGWNQIDFVIVVLSTIDIIISAMEPDNHLLRSFRVLRVLRTVKMIRLNEEMRVVFGALVECIPTVMAVCALSALFYMSFGILGVGLFAGKFFRCDCGGEWGSPALNCTNADFTSLDKPGCLAQGGEWRNPPANFDNIFNALRTLFICSTTEGWVTVMYSAVDATEIDAAPVLDTTPEAAIFFVLFLIVGSFFITNLFIGVLVNFFGEANGSLLLTTKQKQWMQTQVLCKSVMPSVYVPPEGGLRGGVNKLVETAAFGYGFSLLIVANVAMLMYERVPMDPDVAENFELANIVLLCLFTAEIVLKVIAYNPAIFIDDGWNQLDFFTVVMSWVGVMAEGIGGIQALRAIRVMRLMLLLKNAKGLRALMKTLFVSLLPACNITILLVLVLFVYGVVGMHLYGGMPRGQYITDNDNFDDIIHSLRLLFQIATGQDFMNLMHELDLAGANLVFTFFGSYIIASIWIFFNLFVAVLLENFEHNFTASQMTLTMWHIDEFKQVWLEFAQPPELDMVSVTDLPKIVARLSAPLGDICSDPLWIKRLHFELKLDGAVSAEFHDVLEALCLVSQTYDGLLYAQQQVKRQEVRAATEEHAARVLTLCIRTWLLQRRPPPEDVVENFKRDQDDSELIVQARYNQALAGIRFMLLSSMVRCTKVIQGVEGKLLAAG